MSDRMRVVVWLVVVALCAVFLSQCDGPSTGSGQGGGVDPVSPVPRPTLAPPVSPVVGTIGEVE
jgi:hypothetical protein